MTKNCENDEKILKNASGFSMSLETLKQYEGDYSAMLPGFLAKYDILRIQTEVTQPTMSRLHNSVQGWEKGLEDIVRSLEEEGVSGACIKTLITVKKKVVKEVVKKEELSKCIQSRIRVLETRLAFLQSSSCGDAYQSDSDILDEIKRLRKF